MSKYLLNIYKCRGGGWGGGGRGWGKGEGEGEGEGEWVEASLYVPHFAR